MKILNLRNLFAAALAAVLFAGCATKNDAVAQAEKSEQNAPGIVETRAIAEQGRSESTRLNSSHRL